MPRSIKEKYDSVTDLLNEIRNETFHDPSSVTDAQAMGILISQYLLHPCEIAKAAAYALEDANAHELSGQLLRWARG